MIIFIHGFGSSGQGGKADLFRNYFKSKGQPFIAPSLSYVPELAMSTLEELINLQLIGSSLGGYYSIYLAEKYGLKAVLINPAVQSSKILQRAVNLQGNAPNYYDGSSFEWKASHLEMLKAYSVESVESDNYLLLLQKGDDVLDYREAIEKIPNAQMVVEEGGTHSFEGIERYFDRVDGFLY